MRVRPMYPEHVQKMVASIEKTGTQDLNVITMGVRTPTGDVAFAVENYCFESISSLEHITRDFLQLKFMVCVMLKHLKCSAVYPIACRSLVARIQ